MLTGWGIFAAGTLWGRSIPWRAIVRRPVTLRPAMGWFVVRATNFVDQRIDFFFEQIQTASELRHGVAAETWTEAPRTWAESAGAATGEIAAAAWAGSAEAILPVPIARSAAVMRPIVGAASSVMTVATWPW